MATDFRTGLKINKDHCSIMYYMRKPSAKHTGLQQSSQETWKHITAYKCAKHLADLLIRRPVTDTWLQFSDEELVCHVQFGNAVEDGVDVGKSKYALRRSNAVAERLHILQHRANVFSLTTASVKNIVLSQQHVAIMG